MAPTPASTGTQHGAAREARTASYPKGADQPAAGDHPATDHPATDHPNEAAPRTKRWIPGLDGLRAIAVIAVVLFHLNPDYLSGGFLGVDLFFVISGYLITRLLVAEHQRTGRISIGRFYLRRARRLLPAVALLLAVVSVAGGLIWRDQRPTLAGGLFSSMGYVTNWWLIGDHQSYFVAMGRPPMLQHLWSLAIEEQYYLLWAPAVLVLTGAWFACRRILARVRGPVLLAGVAVLLAVASAAAMAAIAIATNVPYQADSSRVYFGTDTHAMGLLLGSAAGALAALPWRSLRRRVPRWVRPAWRSTWATRPLLPRWIVGDAVRKPLSPWVTDALAVAGLAGVVWFFLSIDEYVPWLYRGGFLVFAAVAVVVVACAARPDGHIGRVLDTPPLKWIGERSYGIYLWHWPVFVVTRPMIDVQGPAWLIDITRAALAVTIAAASYRYLELPVREGRFLASLRTTWRLRAARRAAAARPVARSAGRPAGRPVARIGAPGRHWAMPALVTGCMAVLIAAHLSAIQQPAWAGSVPSAALPLPGVAPSLPAGVPDSDPDPDTGSAGASPSEVTSALSAAVSPTAGPIVGTAGASGGRAEGDTTGAPGAASSRAPSTVSSTVSSTAVAPVIPPSSVGPTASATTSSTTHVATSTGGSTTVAPTTAPAPPPPAKSNAKVSAFGDSVLLGAAPAVKAAVGSLSLDAVVGRQAWDTLADVATAEKAGKLAPIVLIHTGNNGIISPKQLAATLASLASRTKVIVMNDHVDRTWQGPNNRTIASMTGHYPNVVIVDWNAAAAAHPSWFGPDGIHVNPSGAQGYAALVAAAIAS
ncbi:MAG: hypothetical protein BGO26_12530 [Actinobacteria bacterium 69-20]|nr:MAG: hypothetical protein BGO26_12530 [Actinobacteria bacterium 69-20]